MTMQDPVADMLTRIRNGQQAKFQTVRMDSSKLKVEIARVLKEEGFIADYTVDENDGKPILTITLKYHEGVPVIARIKRISRPGLRCYKSAADIKRERVSAFGLRIVTTSHGVMSDSRARAAGIGGEIVCEVA